MRVFVFFDLPVETAAQRREYRLFHKHLESEGFLMLQQSVYVRLAINNAYAERVIARLREHRPKWGLVQALKVTEKQFVSMENISGSRSAYDEIDSLEDFVVI